MTEEFEEKRTKELMRKDLLTSYINIQKQRGL